MTDQMARPSAAHLRRARMLRVVEIVVINAEKRVQVNGRRIPQAQGLEIIYLFHQTCAEPHNHLTNSSLLTERWSIYSSEADTFGQNERSDLDFRSHNRHALDGHGTDNQMDQR